MNTIPLLAGNQPNGPFAAPIDAALELGAYEELWRDRKTSFKSIAERLIENFGARPSDFVLEDDARETSQRVLAKLRDRVKGQFGLRLHGELDYPCKLRDAQYPVELLYFQGIWDILNTRSVAVVGTRRPSEDGRKRARNLVKCLLRDKFTIVSGLADGIDTEAHNTAIAEGGLTIAVIGTPLGNFYPQKNECLQRMIAEKYLLISQVPVERYDAQTPRTNRFFFPERNKTMSALTEATVIVEAGETSGTLIQAREALRQGRKLFVLNSCFENPKLAWPRKLEDSGAIRVRKYADIQSRLVH